MNMKKGMKNNMKAIDFSCKHDVLLRNPDGSLQPMDEPYFEATLIAPETWCVLSDGDYSYFLAGKEDTLVIDSGYGAGNIREYLQTLTDKPVRYIANTHHHFDHTANNCYFDCAYMAAAGIPLATIPYKSFEGIDFPRDYQIKAIDEGYRFDLGGREIEVFSMPDHAISSLVFLDREARILFVGDELGNHGKSVNGTVQGFALQLEKLLAHRNDFDWLCSGSHAMIDARFVERYWENARYILAGNEGAIREMRPKRATSTSSEGGGPIVYDRKKPRSCDMGGGNNGKRFGFEEETYKRVMNYADCTITYDVRRIV